MTYVFQMPSASGGEMELKQYEDMLFPNLDVIDPERDTKFAKTFDYKEGDIVQCSYPKSGFHWFGNMIWKLKDLQPSDRPKDDVIEFANQEKYDKQRKPRIICSHLTAHRLLVYPAHIENKGKVVLILRNPKDVLVSWYFHLKNTSAFNNRQTIEEFFESFMKGEIPWGSYFGYLKDWEGVLKDVSDGKSNLQVEVFYYEDFVQNPKESIARLNTYLGFNRDDVYLERVLMETTFNALRKMYTSPGLQHPLGRDADGNSVIFRKGKVGDWKNYLTVAQSEAVENMVTKTLKHDFIKFKYEIYCA